MNATLLIILKILPIILQGVLAAIGLLKLLARWTPWKWDDLVLDWILHPRQMWDKKATGNRAK